MNYKELKQNKDGYILSIASGAQNAIIYCDTKSRDIIAKNAASYYDILPIVSLAINNGGGVDTVLIANV